MYFMCLVRVMMCFNDRDKTSYRNDDSYAITDWLNSQGFTK